MSTEPTQLVTLTMTREEAELVALAIDVQQRNYEQSAQGEYLPADLIADFTHKAEMFEALWQRLSDARFSAKFGHVTR